MPCTILGSKLSLQVCDLYLCWCRCKILHFVREVHVCFSHLCNLFDFYTGFFLYFHFFLSVFASFQGMSMLFGDTFYDRTECWWWLVHFFYRCLINVPQYSLVSLYQKVPMFSGYCLYADPVFALKSPATISNDLEFVLKMLVSSSS